jgi:regulatory protein
MLARREYARAELAARLLRGGADADEVARLLDELEQRGYLSDTRYAQMLVSQRAGRYGRRAIAHTLVARGVSASAANAAMTTLAHGDERAEATALWQRRFGHGPKDDRERARQVRFLMARGYPMSVALHVVPRAGRDAGDDVDQTP